MNPTINRLGSRAPSAAADKLGPELGVDLT
jgi:hypothetical protein